MKPAAYQTRKSISSPAASSSRTRKNVESNEEQRPDETLFNTVMSDPMRRMLVLKMLAEEKGNIEKYKRMEERKKRLLHCESPTALHRRRALEKMRRDSDSTSALSDTKVERLVGAPVAFDRVLDGVIAYIDIKCKGEDRSAGAKALMTSMGARVISNFSREVTHVIFKDGSFNTYQTAKLRKTHFVSVLWLEAVRKNSFRVPEKNYPALGTEAFDVNVSQICKEYEEVVRDELRRSFATKGRKTALPSELRARHSEVIIPTSQDWEAKSIISYGKTATSDENSDRLELSTPELTSDDDSGCGVINGHSMKHTRDSLLDSLNCALQIDVANKRRSSETTLGSRSTSLLGNRKSSYDYVDMDLTKNVVEGPDKTNGQLKSGDTLLSDNSTDLLLCKIRERSSTKFKEPYVDLSGSRIRISADRRSYTFESETEIGKKKTNTALDDDGTCLSTRRRLSRNLLHANVEPVLSAGDNKNGSRSQRELGSKSSMEMSPLRISYSDADTEIKTVGNALTTQIIPSSVSVEMSPLRISFDSSNGVQKEIQSNSSEQERRSLQETGEKSLGKPLRRSSRRHTLSVTSEPSKPNLKSNSKGSVRSSTSFSPINAGTVGAIITSLSEACSPTNKKQTKYRKLYNLNQSFDDTYWKSIMKDRERNSKSDAPSVAKKITTVPLVPISITPVVKKLLEGREKPAPKPKTKKRPKTKKQPKTPKPVKKPLIDNTKDEQKALTNEYTNKSPKRKGEDQEEPQPAKKIASQKNNLIVPEANRRSSFEFVQSSEKRQHKLGRRPKRSSIVCTRLHRQEVLTFGQIVKKLKGYFVEDEVSDRTSHLVVGEVKRTINLLRAIARGCWIIKQEWIFKSLESKKWLPEEDYEVTDFSPSIQQCRMQRQAFGPLYSMDIFENCGSIFVARSSIPKRSDLQELITLCKGTVTNVAYNASVIVGEYVRHKNVVCVTELWILDSIACNEKKSFKKYLITS